LFYRNIFPYIEVTLSNKIQNLIIPETMMSWFFTVQEAERGGNIRIAHSYFCELTKHDEHHFSNKKGEQFLLKNIKGIEVETPEKSLFLFNGGDFWHSITPPEGNRCRITLGGFMALNKEKNKIVYWS
jgi:hypothetical protein